jgi:V/A-type H+-transporting ATPase subunit E
MTNDTPTPDSDATGVQDLIDKLKHAGVSQGREEAEQLVAEARAEAMALIDQARTECSEMVARATEEAKQIEVNGKQALNLAARDATLKLKEQLQHEFEKELGDLVGQSLQDHDLIRQMILEITAAAVTSPEASSGEGQTQVEGQVQTDSQPSGKLQLLISAGNDPEANKKLDEFVRGLSAEFLAKGVQLQVAGEPDSGVRVKLLQSEVEIELTATALTKWLMRFLAPRFRSVIEASR